MVAVLALGCAGLSKGKGVAQVSSEKEPGHWRMGLEDSAWARKHTPATRGAEGDRDRRAVVPAMDPRHPRPEREQIAAAPSSGEASGGDDYVFEEPAVASEPAKRAHRRQAAAAKRQRAADKRRRVAAAKRQRAAEKRRRVVAAKKQRAAEKRRVAAARKQLALEKRRRMVAAKKRRVAATRQRRASRKPRPARAGSRRVPASAKRGPRQRKLAEIDARPYREPVYDQRGQAIDDEVPDVLKD